MSEVSKYILILEQEKNSRKKIYTYIFCKLNFNKILLKICCCHLFKYIFELELLFCFQRKQFKWQIGVNHIEVLRGFTKKNINTFFRMQTDVYFNATKQV